MRTLETAKEYNARQQSRHMKFTTGNGRDRSTGYVVTIDGKSQWFPNFAQARKHYKESENAESSNGGAAAGIGYDFNS